MRDLVGLLTVTLLALSACDGKPVSSMETSAVVIRGGTALVGAELRPVRDAILVLVGDTIQDVGAAGSVTVPEGAETVDGTGLTLIPGFIDAHVHIAFADPHELVANGVTTARDLAWVPEEIWPLVHRSRSNDFDGPRLLAAGQMLTVEGGYPTRASWAPPGVGRVIDGADDPRRAVHEQVRAGATVIKVALNADAGPTLPARTLRAVVREAHERDLRVTAHVTGLEELEKAVAAGVDELAHVLMSNERIPEPLMRDMIHAGVTVVPTLSVRFGADQDTAVDNLARFLSGGGHVIYGTDLGNAGPTPGIDEREIDAMARSGMNGRAIVKAATVDAANYLGLENTGVLAPGMSADVVAVKGDPIASPSSLTNVTMVWRAGVRRR